MLIRTACRRYELYGELFLPDLIPKVVPPSTATAPGASSSSAPTRPDGAESSLAQGGSGGGGDGGEDGIPVDEPERYAGK